MGAPSQAHRLAALPDVVELEAWMLHLQVMAHSAPEAVAKARGLAVEAVLRQQEFHQLGRLRHCDMISTALAALTAPHCAPDELLHGEQGGLHQLLGMISRACKGVYCTGGVLPR